MFKSCLVILSGLPPLKLQCDFFFLIHRSNVYLSLSFFLFSFTDLDYLFVHGIPAAS